MFMPSTSSTSRLLEFIIGGERFLLFESSGRFGLGALSYINLESRDRSLKVQAFHTFPDDYAIVKSQSVFSLPKK